MILIHENNSALSLCERPYSKNNMRHQSSPYASALVLMVMTEKIINQTGLTANQRSLLSDHPFQPQTAIFLTSYDVPDSNIK